MFQPTTRSNAYAFHSSMQQYVARTTRENQICGCSNFECYLLGRYLRFFIAKQGRAFAGAKYNGKKRPWVLHSQILRCFNFETRDASYTMQRRNTGYLHAQQGLTSMYTVNLAIFLFGGLFFSELRTTNVFLCPSVTLTTISPEHSPAAVHQPIIQQNALYTMYTRPKTRQNLGAP